MYGRSIRRLIASRRSVAALALLAGALVPASARAQRILGGGPDAATLPRGAFRVGLGGESTVQRDRWRDGRLEGLGGSITTDAFGPLQFSLLATVEESVRALGVSGFDASLGSARLDARQRLFVTPLSIEYGLTDWLMLGARASLVRTKVETLFRIRGDSGRATLGVNPYFLGSAVPANNAATIGAYTAASQDLLARLNACQANAGSYPECPTILSEAASVSDLSARSNFLATMLTSIYGAGTARGEPYVPLAGSEAQTFLLARVDSLRLAFQRYGVTNLTASTGLPLAAQVPLAGADLDRLLTDSIAGYGAKRLNKGGLTQVSDVHLGATIRLYDSFVRRGIPRFDADARGLRQAVLVEMRIGTGYAPRADRFFDQGTGSGTSALTVRSITDVVFRGGLWTSVSVGYTKGAPHDEVLRVPSAAGATWLEWWREMAVPVTPGGELDIQVAPRWQIGDYLALGALWHHRSKAADHHEVEAPTTVMPTSNKTVFLFGQFLDDDSAAREQRAGLTATYSTLASVARGHPGLAFEISYIHQQSIASSSGIVPKQWEDRLVVRYYTRFLAR